MKVRTPRARKAVDAAIQGTDKIGAAASRVASQQRFHEPKCTFALDGKLLDPDEKVEALISKGATLDLMLGF